MKSSIPGYEDQTSKPSCMPLHAWLIDVDVCPTSISSAHRSTKCLQSNSSLTRSMSSSSSIYSCPHTVRSPVSSSSRSKPSYPSFAAVHRAWTPHLIFSIAVGRLGAPNTSTLTKPKDMLHNIHNTIQHDASG
jgi:hypothetical protein